MNAIKGFSELYNKDIEPMFKLGFAKSRTTKNFKNKVVDIIKTTDEVMRMITVHYPKTILIATIANVIFTVLFPSIGTLINLTVNGFFVFWHLDYMITSIKEYSSYKKSEWSSSYDDKKVLELIVYGKIFGKEFIDRVSGFFRELIK
ncbi:MAG: hypothetical protein K1060chlam4_00722 [Candidatus Anoxychlamydiales bacterium]|nr:hypothetical protein [Candidatus Anoxychlamydiales bacterium]